MLKMLKPVPKVKTPRSEKYKAFIRRQPCFVCGTILHIAAHHEQEKGQGVMAAKVSDYRTLPLCADCHFSRHYRGRSFYRKVDPETIIATLKQKFKNEGGVIK